MQPDISFCAKFPSVHLPNKSYSQGKYTGAIQVRAVCQLTIYKQPKALKSDYKCWYHEDYSSFISQFLDFQNSLQILH